MKGFRSQTGPGWWCSQLSALSTSRSQTGFTSVVSPPGPQNTLPVAWSDEGLAGQACTSVGGLKPRRRPLCLLWSSPGTGCRPHSRRALMGLTAAAHVCPAVTSDRRGVWVRRGASPAAEGTAGAQPVAMLPGCHPSEPSFSLHIGLPFLLCEEGVCTMFDLGYTDQHDGS